MQKVSKLRRTTSLDRHRRAIQSRNIQAIQDVIYKRFSLQLWFIFQFGFGCFDAVDIFTGKDGLDALVYKGPWIRFLFSFDFPLFS